MSTVDATRYRQVLGHFCTGVTVVTSLDANGAPVGFACQAFSALSLDPPLVLFCPGAGSQTWPHIERAGYFCVNVLAEDQREISRTFGRSGADKFAGVRWSPSSNGAPILDGALTHAACTIESVVGGRGVDGSSVDGTGRSLAGDHLIVIGLVTDLGDPTDGRPLLFYKGRYAGAAPTSPYDPPEVVDTLLAWPRHDDWM